MVRIGVGYDDDREVPLAANDFEIDDELDDAAWDAAETAFAMALQSFATQAFEIIQSGGKPGDVVVKRA